MATAAKKTLPPLGLGVEAEDLITGFKGTVIQMIEQLNGNIQFGLQPRMKGDAFPDAISFDPHTLKVVGVGVSENSPTPVKTDIKLGEKIKSIITGFEGITQEKVTYINGCVRFYVVHGNLESASAKNKSEINGQWIDSITAKRVSDGITKQIAKPADEPTGGPGRKLSSNKITRY